MEQRSAICRRFESGREIVEITFLQLNLDRGIFWGHKNGAWGVIGWVGGMESRLSIANIYNITIDRDGSVQSRKPPTR